MVADHSGRSRHDRAEPYPDLLSEESRFLFYIQTGREGESVAFTSILSGEREQRQTIGVRRKAWAGGKWRGCLAARHSRIGGRGGGAAMAA
jgi:hypothetical protein